MAPPLKIKSKETQIQMTMGNNDEIGDKSSSLKSLPNENLNNVQLVGSQLNLYKGGMAGIVPKVQNNINEDEKKVLLVPPSVDIEFSELSYYVSKGKKCLLKDVNGKFKSGELTAIMGPSGAGKSTLMNILAGYKTSNVKGKILVNGKERKIERFRKLSCYIMQDDCLIPHLTVTEAMHIAADLKLGNDFTADAKKQRIVEILETLGLAETSETKTGKLSGGQRKRLSIALELVNDPPVMFLDEPTSGLDSSSCYQCIKLLQTLARGGRTIICTIHQPSAMLFEMFDYLYTLSDSQCIYQGSISGLVPFLSDNDFNCPSYHNPADYILEVATGEHGPYLEKLVKAVNEANDARDQSSLASSSTSSVQQNMNYNNAIETNKIDKASKCEVPIEDKLVHNIDKPKTLPNATNLAPVTCGTSLLDSDENFAKKPINMGFPTSGWKQFCILLKRTFISIGRDWTLTWLRLISHIVVGLLIGCLYYNIGDDAAKIKSNTGCMFFTVMFTMFTAMMPTIVTFPTEMSVFVREHLNNWYSLRAFYFAKTVADIPIQAFLSVFYVLIIYFMTGQPMRFDSVLMFATINVLTSLVAQSLGLLIGAGMKIETGVYIGPVTTIPVVLFSGFFVNFKVMPDYMRWLTYLSHVRYGFEGAMISIYGYDRPKLNCSETFCPIQDSKYILEKMSIDKGSFTVDVGALCGFFVCLRIFSYIVLKYKLKTKH